jgi:hypothetical protein
MALAQDADTRFKFVAFTTRFASKPVPLGGRSDGVAADAIAALSRGDCDAFFDYFQSYEPGGETATKVCKFSWVKELTSALRRSDAPQEVRRLGGGGYVAFYGIHVGRQAWTALLAAGDDGWYRLMVIARSR